ncbi:hypothetical protein NL676_009827 [Syzygium grande]|nr:hypothetical protein NL676_009827 [Syzygium grande]
MALREPYLAVHANHPKHLLRLRSSAAEPPPADPVAAATRRPATGDLVIATSECGGAPELGTGSGEAAESPAGGSRFRLRVRRWSCTYCIDGLLNQKLSSHRRNRLLF